MATKQEIQAAAYKLGRMLGESDFGDFYDVVEGVIDGYVHAEPLDSDQVWKAEADRYGAISRRLYSLHGLRAAAETVIGESVEDARDVRMTWQEIGDALDVSKQAAQQKYGK
jgi:hypothetical protein